MTLTTVLAAIGGIVIVIGAVARIPHAMAELVRACVPVIGACHELRAAFGRSVPQTGRKKSGTSTRHLT